MARHNKWSQIKRKKAIADQKKGQAFTRLSKLITMSAKQSGGDPSMNAQLTLLLQKAKAVNMTKDLIERAIKKGTGSGEAQSEIQEVLYEGYAPHGVAMIVRTLTDNRTRTIGNLRHIFSKFGGELGDSGTVSFLFQKRGIIEIEFPKELKDLIELQIIDAGVIDMEEIDEGKMECIMEPTELHQVKQSLESTPGIQITEMKLGYLPTMECELDTKEKLEEVMGFIEKVEEDEDVDEIFTNIRVDSVVSF